MRLEVAPEVRATAVRLCLCAFQLACLTELQQWLSFATDEHLGTFPLQRVLHALFQLLQGRAPDAAAAAAGCGQTGTLEGSSQMDPDVANPAATASQEALDEQLARELSGGTDEQVSELASPCVCV